jgi:hypothetical protein
MTAAFLLSLVIAQSTAADRPPPSREEFGRRVWEAFKLDYQLQKDFIYLERRRDVKISRLGKVTVGPLRTFEVFPSDKPGGTYKRLIAIDGKPLSRDELAPRDAEHARDLEEAARRARTETPEQRKDREDEAAEEARHRADMQADAVAVFEATSITRETFEGYPVLVAELKPRADAHVKTREGRWMKRFAGRVWVAADDYQLVKIDMRAFDDISIGWGVIGRINKGSRLVYIRRRHGAVWLPSETIYEASGRTLLFRPFQISVTATYSDYKPR